MKPKVISFDFDDTLLGYDGYPIYPMVDRVKFYQNKGFKCIIVTSRFTSQFDTIKEFLQQEGISDVEIFSAYSYDMRGYKSRTFEALSNKWNIVYHYDNDWFIVEEILNNTKKVEPIYVISQPAYDKPRRKVKTLKLI